MTGPVSIEVGGLLFDNDGVIVDSIASVNRCWTRWAERYNVPDWESFEIPHGTRAVDVVKQVASWVDPAEGLKAIEDMEVEDLADVVVLPGVRTLLNSLPKDKWAIVSSATWRLLTARLQAAELPIPDSVVTGDRVVQGKPHPEPYLKGAEMLGVAPGDCLVIEDAPSGVGAGKAAGCRVLGVLGTHTAEQLKDAGVDWVVASLEGVTAEVVAGGLRVSFEAV